MKLNILLLVFILLSCNDNLRMKKDLIKLNSSPIVIPTDMMMIWNGKDTVVNDFFDCKLKFVVYADSLGCTSCNINKMDLWNDLLQYANKIDIKLNFYFIFRPIGNNKTKTFKSLMTSPFNYPICIDQNGDFEKLNPHLPKNKAMHTFLLDENNKVILVGNPLHNKEIEKLFYKITQEKLGK